MIKTNRRSFLKNSALGVAGAVASPYLIGDARAAGSVDVGVLFSLTGGMSIIETSLKDATLLAISEINAKGGVLGRQINPIVEDGATDPKTFAERASKLAIQDKTETIFGLYVSATRKAVLPVIEKRNKLLFYPTFYEGYECSRNVIYTGAVINQIVWDAVPWIVKKLGKKKFFIVGSNFLYSREASKVTKGRIKQAGAEWVADEYLEFGSAETASLVNKIKESGADIVFSNIVGSSVIAFYREYKNQGLTQEKLPIFSTVTTEIEIAALGPEFSAGSYTSLPYFQAIDSHANRSFIQRYRAFVKNPKAVTHQPVESSYFQVYLWKQAVEKAGSFQADAVRDAVRGQEFDAPDGRVKVDPENLHTWFTPRIAQWQPDGQGKIVEATSSPVRPLPYAAYGETDDNLFCTPNGLDQKKLKS
jgi:urea transport system substrate-binding protein